MTFEERIERLTERHEALAQSLEVLTVDVRELQTGLKELGVKVDQLTSKVDQLTTDVQKHDAVIAQILEATTRNNDTVANLAFIARMHSERLQRLEEGKR